MGKAKKSVITVEKFDSLQKVVLTDKEILQAGENTANALKDMGAAENEIASIKKQYQSKIDGLKCTMEHESNLIRDRYEMRTVKCERIYDYTAGTVQETRMDSGEVIARREMTESEKQMKLSLDVTKPADEDQGEPKDN